MKRLFTFLLPLGLLWTAGCLTTSLDRESAEKILREKRTESYPAVLTYFKNAAEKGDSQAAFYYGVMLAGGLGCPPDPAAALPWLEQARKSRNDRATLLLGECYEAGRGCTPSLERAVACYREAAESKYAPAQIKLAGMFMSGRGVPLDYAKARELLEQAAASGSASAVYELGVMYLYGRGVAPGERTALDYLTRAAKAGHPDAMVLLAGMYLDGQGVPRNDRVARELLLNASGRSATAKRLLAGMLAEGRGGERNQQEALRLYHAAAAEGDLESLYQAGMMTYLGQGVRVDRVAGARLFEVGAAAGHESCILALAHYERTMLQKNDLAEKRYRQLIAKQDSLAAYVALSQMLTAEAGKEQEALKLLDQAERKHPGNVLIWMRRGEVLMKQKNYQAASREFLRGLDKMPHAVLAEHAGDAFAAMNDKTRALQYYRQALSLTPSASHYRRSGLRRKVEQFSEGK